MKVSVFKYLCVLLLFFSNVLVAQKNITSRVVDIKTNKPVSDVSVEVIGTTKGIYTNEEGVFVLEGLSSKTKIKLSKIGYESLILDLSEVETSIYISPKVSVLDEVLLRSFSSSQLRNTIPDQIYYTQKDIEKLPYILGEKDVIKLIQYTPGVQQAAEGQSGLLVRGGNGSMNLTVLDHIYLHNTAHLGGLFSAINSDFVSSLEFSKAGFDAVYGGRLASITDIKTLKKPDSTSFSGSLGLLSAKLTGNIKLNEKHSVLLSGRRTYLEALKPFFEADNSILGKDKNYFLHDFLAKHGVKLSKKSQLETTFYTTKDEFRDQTDDRNRALEWGNTLIGTTFQYQYNSNLRSHTTLFKSDYRFSFSDDEFPFDYEANSAFDVLGAQHYFTLQKPKYVLKTGIAYNRNTILPKRVRASIDNSPVEILNQETYKFQDLSVFSDLEFAFSRALKAKAGLRVSTYITAANNLIDEDTYTALEPRLSLKYQFSEHQAFKLSYQRLEQFIHQATIGTLNLPADFFVISTAAVAPQKSNQFSMGYVYETNDLQFNSAVYYKNVQNYTEFENGSVNNLFSNNIYDDILIGEFSSYGLELSLKKKINKLTAQASVTLSKTVAKFDEINQGNYFPATFDRPINLNGIAHYKLNNRIELSALFLYTSGQNYTRPKDIRIVSQRPILNFEPKNASRFPDYHRLDLSCTYAFKPRGKWRSKLNLTLYNVYNNKNPFQISFFTFGDTGDAFISITEERDNLFPFLPTVNWSFSF